MSGVSLVCGMRTDIEKGILFTTAEAVAKILNPILGRGSILA